VHKKAEGRARLLGRGAGEKRNQVGKEGSSNRRVLTVDRFVKEGGNTVRGF